MHICISLKPNAELKFEILPQKDHFPHHCQVENYWQQKIIFLKIFGRFV